MAFAPPLSQSNMLTRKLSSSLHTRNILRFPKQSHVSTSCRRQSVVASIANPDTKIGFIGLGVMGLPMAANLAKDFNNLVVWNRSDKTAALSEALASTGASVHSAKQPSDVIRECDYTFSMLSTPQAVQNVFFDHDGAALQAVSSGKNIIDCSTLRVEDMQKTYQIVADKGGQFIEAPVSGSKGPAEQGQLIFLCGGDRVLYDDPITQNAFALMGKKSFYLGDVGTGTRMKLIINQLMIAMLAAMGESMVLTEKLELSVPDLLEIISLGAMSNPMFALKGPKMQQGVSDYTPNFSLEHAEKDINFAQLLAGENNVEMDVCKAAHDMLKTAKELGWSKSDFSAVIESVRSTSK